MSSNNKKSITEFFDNQYLNYSKYVVKDRAIPSVIDGFKPVHRKIINEAIHYWKNDGVKPMKLFQFGGLVAYKQYYHHGDSSLTNAIVTMAQKFKNSLPLLDSIGQFGDLRDPNPGAPRYISTKLTPYFKLLYKDNELLTPKIDEGVEIEPEYFLPIVPTILLNGTSGIAVGFATDILNRNPYDLIDSCLNVLDGKKQKSLKPCVYGFSGTFEPDKENPKTWYAKGKYEIVNTTTVHISEIPPQFSFDDYEKVLDKLQEKGVIVSYVDNSSDSIDYTLKFQRSVLNELVNNEKLESTLSLSKKITENLTTINENGELKIFDSPNEIVDYFVNFRLPFYQKRKDYKINCLNEEILMISNKLKFIKAIIEKKLVVNNQPKEKIISYLENNKFTKFNGNFDYLLRLPIYTLTKEKYEELLKELAIKKEVLDEIKKITPKEMYVTDLKDLKKSLINLKIK